MACGDGFRRAIWDPGTATAGNENQHDGSRAENGIATVGSSVNGSKYFNWDGSAEDTGANGANGANGLGISGVANPRRPQIDRIKTAHAFTRRSNDSTPESYSAVGITRSKTNTSLRFGSGVQSAAVREKGDWDALFFQSAKQQLLKAALPGVSPGGGDEELHLPVSERGAGKHRRVVSNPGI